MVLNFLGESKGVVSYTINAGKKVYSRKVKEEDGKKFVTQDGMRAIYNGKTLIMMGRDGAPLAQTVGLTPMQSEFHIDMRFGFLENFSEMVISGETASLLVSGEGGLGKSHTVMEQLYKQNLEEGTDYVVVKGYATPKALYATLFENKNAIVVFDDCDSVLKDPTALNILKGALDSYDKRTISWLSKGFIDDGLPSSFDFEGQVIFISNMGLDKIDGAVKSRTMAVDLSMTLQDKVDRMRTILPNILPEYSMAVKNKVMDFLELHKEEATEFNMRTLQKVIKVAAFADDKNIDWEQPAKYLLTNV